jgi:uncharacterized protein (DUF2235 family)
MSLYQIDGTWNTHKNGEVAVSDTNVLRFGRAYEGIGIFYERGVGTRLGVLGRIFGGIAGAGGDARIERQYRNICRTFIAGDRDIEIVGFSRGAALALDLVNMLQDRGIRDPQTGRVIEPHPKVRFLGLWDTVGAFGIPFNFLFPFQRWNIGHRLRLSPDVEHCFHALALDERRAEFTVERLEGAYEVWFRGVHADVGGGNGNTALSNITLRWMLRKAKAVGLPIDDTRIPAQVDIDPLAPLREPFDVLETRLRELRPGDRVHYTVTPRADGRYNDPGADCTVEGEAAESTAVRAGRAGAIV